LESDGTKASGMSDEEIQTLIQTLKKTSAKHDRKQRFNWETRNLTPEQKSEVELQVRKGW
jgi:hypothetical protein